MMATKTITQHETQNADPITASNPSNWNALCKAAAGHAISAKRAHRAVTPQQLCHAQSEAAYGSELCQAAAYRLFWSASMLLKNRFG